MPILIRDYETRSTLDLRDVGAWRYSTHASTDVWCAAYAVDDSPVELWIPGDPIPAVFTEAANDSGWVLAAFNDGFERLIEQHVLGPRHGWPAVPIERHRCLQAAALARALPGSLDGAARALKLSERKDDAGRRVMLQMSRPRKPRKDEEPKGVYWFDDPERRQQLYDYCKQDVLTERELHKHIPLLEGDEQALWLLDQDINDRGVHVDRQLLDAAIKIAQQAQTEINVELAKITSGEIDSIHQVSRLLQWLNAHGCKLKSIHKESLEQTLGKELPDATRRVIELRLDGAHAAANKLDTMRAWLNADNRARGCLKFHGASTGRWSSYGIQLQNLKRPVVEDIDKAIEAVASGSLQQLRQHYPQPMSVVGDVTRAMICAAPGHRLIAADLSGVESRITAWVSGQQSKLDMWKRFVETGNPEDEPYYILGLKLGVAKEKARAIGKTADLAFGYMGGLGAWKKLAGPDDDSSEELIKQRQYRWRDAHPQTRDFWKAIDSKAIRAVQHPFKRIKFQNPLWRHISFESDGVFLFMYLPSGRKIAYPHPHLRTDTERGNVSVVFMDWGLRGWGECRFGLGAYGGTWIENAVQAVARDILADAMPRLEKAGYRIALHVHDEIVAEVPEGFGSADEFLKILITPPAWAAGLPLAAKVREGARFCKSKSKPVEPEPTVEADPEPEEEPAPWQDQESEQRAFNGYQSGERMFGSTTAEYIYLDQKEQPYLKVRRTSQKQFPQYHFEDGRWVKGAPKGPRIPFMLPELLAAPATEPVWIPEGEKDVLGLAALGLIATCNPEGAGKWTPELNQWFRGKQCGYILEDNDEAGRAHARKVADNLRDVVPELRIVSFPELLEKGDVSDWLEQGHTKQELIDRAKTSPIPTPSKGYTLVCAADIIPRPLDWLWPGHIARGSLELLTGVPGGGKSQVHCSVIASATSGHAWPDGPNTVPPGNVIMLVAEDCLEQTIAPRLIAAGADRNRVFILRKIKKDNKNRMFLLHEDIEMLEQVILDVGDARLVTIDPITAFMGGKVDSHRATDVRGQLGPLSDLAERLPVAISAITHPPKHSSQRAIDHFIGSQAFIATARIGHVAIAEVDEDEHGNRMATGRWLLANPKNNLAQKMPTLAYRIVEKQLEGDIKIAHVVWEETVDITADQAVAAAAGSKERGQASGVVLFLLDILSNRPMPQSFIEERAGAHGFSNDQLKRAKRKLSIVSFKAKGVEHGNWTWALPQHAPPLETAKADSVH
jgi:DNA polymerase